MERFNGAIIDLEGNAIDGVTVTVRKESDLSLATIYSDDGITTKANPFTSGPPLDTQGEFFFYAANDRYRIELTGPTTQTREDILLHDPGETRLPTTSNDEALARFNGTGGNIQNSANGPFVNDSGQMFSAASGGAQLGGRIVGTTDFNLPPNNDLDDVDATGIYYSNASTANRPESLSEFFFVRTIGRSDTKRQIAFGMDTPELILTRKFSGAAWGSWTRLITQIGGQLSGALDYPGEVTVASAATVDLGAQAGNFVGVTGTTTITSFGTSAAGVWRWVRFAGALTLTHNATSLILPTGASITTAANDVCLARSLGSGNWIVTQYHRDDGSPLAPSTAGLIFLTRLTASASASLSYTGTPSDAKRLICRLSHLIPATDDVELHLRVMQGGSPQTGASDYNYRAEIQRDQSTTNQQQNANGASFIQMGETTATWGVDSAGYGMCGTVVIEAPNKTGVGKEILFDGRWDNNISAGDHCQIRGGGSFQGNTNAIQGPEFAFSSGNITSGDVDIYKEI